MSRVNLPVEILRELLRYDPETGKLFWRQRDIRFFKDGAHSSAHTCAKWNSRFAGKEAFTALSAGRPHGRIFRVGYFASRVAWAITHGEWPEEIDHINHDQADNRLSNLRACTHAQNMMNQSPTRGATSKYLGVSWSSDRRKWAAAITVNRKIIPLGRFSREEDAAMAYDAAAKAHFGSFANLNFGQLPNIARTA